MDGEKVMQKDAYAHSICTCTLTMRLETAIQAKSNEAHCTSIAI